MCTPLLRRLKKKYPQTRIDVLCEKIGVQLLEHNPHVTQLLHLNRKAGPAAFLRTVKQLRGQHYDWVIDAQSLPKTAVLAALSGAGRRFGFGKRRVLDHLYTDPYLRRNADYSAADKLKLIGEMPTQPTDLTLDFPVSAQSVASARAFVATYFDQRPVAALFGVSRRSYKVWPGEKLAALATRLVQDGYLPFLVYGPGEEADARAIAKRIDGDTVIDYEMPDFASLKEILGHCHFFAGNDGGPKHLAAIAGIPTVAIFGHVHPEAWTPPADPHHAFVATASASRAVHTQGPCEMVSELAEISVDAVYAGIQKILTETQSESKREKV